jgi:hypothetical protein
MAFQHPVDTGQACHLIVTEVESNNRFTQAGIQKCPVDAIHHGEERFLLADCECGKKCDAHGMIVYACRPGPDIQAEAICSTPRIVG